MPEIPQEKPTGEEIDSQQITDKLKAQSQKLKDKHAELTARMQETTKGIEEVTKTSPKRDQ